MTTSRGTNHAGAPTFLVHREASGVMYTRGRDLRLIWYTGGGERGGLAGKQGPFVPATSRPLSTPATYSRRNQSSPVAESLPSFRGFWYRDRLIAGERDGRPRFFRMSLRELVRLFRTILPSALRFGKGKLIKIDALALQTRLRNTFVNQRPMN